MAPKKGKRKAESSDSDGEAMNTKKGKSSASEAKAKAKVNPKRWRELKDNEVGNGPVIYWWAPSADPDVSIIRAKHCTSRLPPDAQGRSQTQLPA